MEFCGQPYARTNEEAKARMKNNPNMWSGYYISTSKKSDKSKEVRHFQTKQKSELMNWIIENKKKNKQKWNKFNECVWELQIFLHIILFSMKQINWNYIILFFSG